MTYTSGQYAILQRLESGLMYDDLTEAEREVLRYLDQSGLVQPRADIRDGYYTISQAGARVLSAYRENAARTEYAREKDAEQKKQWHFENKVSVLNLLIALASFLVGVCFDYHFGIYEKLSKFFQWLRSIF